jgi:hypothetical protein
MPEHEREIMKTLHLLVAVPCALSLSHASAETIASVEPIASASVVDIMPFLEHDLEVRAAFAGRLLQCGIVDDVERVLSRARVTTTINDANTRFRLSAGGFAGNTNPTFAFSLDDRGRNAASHADIQLLTDSLGFAMSQDSVFLLDKDNPDSFEFPANFVALEFRHTPRLEDSAALFETVGRIDPELFETDTSGYTQVGRAYISLQSDVPDDEFIAGYVEAAREFGVAYTPIVDGKPSLAQGGAGFPGNDWVAHPAGEDYLSRIPVRVHTALRHLRDVHLSFTRRALRTIRRAGDDRRELLQALKHLDCR